MNYDNLFNLFLPFYVNMEFYILLLNLLPQRGNKMFVEPILNIDN